MIRLNLYGGWEREVKYVECECWCEAVCDSYYGYFIFSLFSLLLFSPCCPLEPRPHGLVIAFDGRSAPAWVSILELLPTRVALLAYLGRRVIHCELASKAHTRAQVMGEAWMGWWWCAWKEGTTAQLRSAGNSKRRDFLPVLGDMTR